MPAEPESSAHVCGGATLGDFEPGAGAFGHTHRTHEVVKDGKIFHECVRNCAAKVTEFPTENEAERTFQVFHRGRIERKTRPRYQPSTCITLSASRPFAGLKSVPSVNARGESAHCMISS